MRTLAATAILLAAHATPAAQPGYDFEWRAVATLSVWEAGDTVTTRGERTGRGPLRLWRMADGRLAFEFSGPDGEGRGVVFGEILERLTFPQPLPVGRPPAPGHLQSGTYKAVGDGVRPAAFDVAWAEGFICRTTPPRCGNVTAWSRELTGHATRVDR
jgi:hypothetical protein